MTLFLGHFNGKHISKQHKNVYLNKFNFESYKNCETCQIGKMAKISLSKKVKGPLRKIIQNIKWYHIIVYLILLLTLKKKVLAHLNGHKFLIGKHNSHEL